MGETMRDRIGSEIGAIIADAVLRFVAVDGEPTVDDLRAYADRVLAEMREPTKGMIDVGYDEAEEQMDSSFSSLSGTEYRYLRSDATKAIWQAMIDAATKDPA